MTSRTTNKWHIAVFVALLLSGASANAQRATDVVGQYRLRGGDRVSIKFPYHQELNEPSLSVRPDGFITLSMIEDVRAVGLTVTELKYRIEKAYAEILVNPVVSINLLDFVQPRVFVSGQVGKPGSFDLRSGQTLAQAIALAGGFTRDANRRLVLHARPQANGSWQITEVDALKLFSDAKTARDIALRDGDYIFVPDSKLSRFARVMEVFNGLVPRFGLGR